MPYTEDTLLAISALQHYLYCPRQCALIHLEQAWAENRFTAEGQVLHKTAHDGLDLTRPGVRLTHSLPVRSLSLGIAGQCDIVEFHDDGQVTPVEYKRGKPKSHHADEVQLCAQALCLEEMQGCRIPHGYLYYGKRKRRTEVPFSEDLRNITQNCITDLRHLLSQEKTPPAQYDVKKCTACSLIDLCQPQGMRLQRGASAWFTHQLSHQLSHLHDLY